MSTDALGMPSSACEPKEDEDMQEVVPEPGLEIPVAAPKKMIAVQCSGGAESFAEVSDALCMGGDNPLQTIMGFWEKMVADRPASDPRSMHHQSAMRNVMIGNSNSMVNFYMVKEAAGGEDADGVDGACGAAGR